MTRIDEAAFTRALVEAFPAVEFWDVGHLDGKRIESRVPALHLADALFVSVRLARPGWTPELGEMDEEGYWTFQPIISFTIHRSVWHWTTRRDDPSVWHPPILRDGAISTSYRKGDAFAQNFVETTWRRLLPKVAEYFRNCTWAGHDALRWASEAPRRMIDGYIRPPEGWDFAKLRPAKRKYYEGLEAMRPESDPQPPPETLE